MARDAIKLALPGFRHLVDWWGLPTRLEWALAPDRGALGYQTGSLAARMAFGRLRGPWEQELKTSYWWASGQSPGRASGVTPGKLSVGGMLALVLL